MALDPLGEGRTLPKPLPKKALGLTIRGGAFPSNSLGAAFSDALFAAHARGGLQNAPPSAEGRSNWKTPESVAGKQHLWMRKCIVNFEGIASPLHRLVV